MAVASPAAARAPRHHDEQGYDRHGRGVGRAGGADPDRPPPPAEVHRTIGGGVGRLRGWPGGEAHAAVGPGALVQRDPQRPVQSGEQLVEHLLGAKRARRPPVDLVATGDRRVDREAGRPPARREHLVRNEHQRSRRRGLPPPCCRLQGQAEGGAGGEVEPPRRREAERPARSAPPQRSGSGPEPRGDVGVAESSEACGDSFGVAALEPLDHGGTLHAGRQVQQAGGRQERPEVAAIHIRLLGEEASEGAYRCLVAVEPGGDALGHPVGPHGQVAADSRFGLPAHGGTGRQRGHEPSTSTAAATRAGRSDRRPSTGSAGTCVLPPITTSPPCDRGWTCLPSPPGRGTGAFSAEGARCDGGGPAGPTTTPAASPRRRC